MYPERRPHFNRSRKTRRGRRRGRRRCAGTARRPLRRGIRRLRGEKARGGGRRCGPRRKAAPGPRAAKAAKAARRCAGLRAVLQSVYPPPSTEGRTTFAATGSYRLTSVPILSEGAESRAVTEGSERRAARFRSAASEVLAQYVCPGEPRPPAAKRESILPGKRCA